VVIALEANTLVSTLGKFRHNARGTSLAEMRSVSRRVITLHSPPPSHSKFAVLPPYREPLVVRDRNETRRRFAPGLSHGSITKLRRDRIECSERLSRKS
jgi:hypothetical protein